MVTVDSFLIINFCLSQINHYLQCNPTVHTDQDNYQTWPIVSKATHSPTARIVVNVPFRNLPHPPPPTKWRFLAVSKTRKIHCPLCYPSLNEKYKKNHLIFTSLSTGGQLVEWRERMYEMCLPRLRWILQHSLHTSTPRLIEAQLGSAHKKNDTKDHST